MSIQECICPRCGGPVEGEGLCGRCRGSSTTWVTFDPRVTSVHCPSCNSQKNGSTWTDTERGRDEIGPEIVRAAVHFHPDIRSSSISMVIRDRTLNRSYAEVSVAGMLYGQEVHANAVIEIVWQKEQCNRCNRISGSYYEGLVQVRAQNRKLLPHESLLAQQIATEVENGMQAGGDRLSYISEMEETREGLDITIGSQQIGLAISQAVVQRLGGRYSTHPKLIGEKAGKKLFRITYSVRLPRYIRGDVVRIGRSYGQIMQIEGQYIRYLDLANGQARSAKEEDFGLLIGNVRDAADALIAYVDGDVLGIIDPGSGVTRECAVGPWRTAAPGQHIRVLKDQDTMILVG